MNNPLVLRSISEIYEFEQIDEYERSRITKAAELLTANFPEHSLLEIWNSAIHNLKRRIEAFSVEMFLSSLVTGGTGKQKYNASADTLAERWSDMDDFCVIQGATRVGVISQKTGKTLEMINWMRNHASAAHISDEEVKGSDVLGLTQLMAESLFRDPLPNRIHSPIIVIESIKNDILSENQIGLIKEQISNYRNVDILTLFGFSMNQVMIGNQPI